MSQHSYTVSFSGTMVDGAEPAEVRRGLARLFKADEKTVERLFSGRPVVIKRGVDHETALKYQAAMRKAGAICEVVEAPPAATSDGELGGVEVAPAGSVLVEHETVAPPVIDTDRLSMAATGEDLVEHGEVTAPVIDTGAMSIAPTGEDLVEREEVAPPEIDTASLTVAEQGSELGEQQDTEAPPPPDTSHLKLEP